MIITARPAIVDAVHATYTDIALNGKRGTARDVQFLGITNVGIKNDQ